MYSLTTEQLVSILKEREGYIDVYATYGDFTIPSDYIEGFSLSNSIAQKGILGIGAVNSSKLSLSLNKGVSISGIADIDTIQETVDGEGNIEASASLIEDTYDMPQDSSTPITIDDETTYITSDENEEELTFPSEWTQYPIKLFIGVNRLTSELATDSDDSYMDDDSAQTGIEDLTFIVDGTETEYDVYAYEDENGNPLTVEQLNAMLGISQQSYEVSEVPSAPADPSETTTTDDADYMIYIPMGEFWVDKSSIVEDGDGIDLVAYDALQFLTYETYRTSISSYPASISSVCNEIASNYGVTFGAVPSTATIKRALKGTVRSVLQTIAYATGTNIFVDRNGLIQFIKPTNPAVDVVFENDEYDELVINGAEPQILSNLAVNCKDVATGTNTRFTATNGYNDYGTFEITSEYFQNQAEVDLIYTNGNFPISYIPYIFSIPIFPVLDVGDLITIKNELDESFVVPIVSSSITYTDKGISQTFSSDSCNDFKLADSKPVGGITMEVDSLKANLIQANEIIASKVSTDYLTANYITANQIASNYVSTNYLTTNYLTANEISSNYITSAYLTTNYLTANQISGTYATISYVDASSVSTAYLEANYTKTTDLAATYATISTLNTNYLTASAIESGYMKVDAINADSAAIGKLWSSQAMLENAFALTLNAAGDVSAVNINADYISAGTLATDRLIIRDSAHNTGILFAINDGIVSQTGLTADELKRLTLNGTVITADSITATQIAAGTITANEIAANTITANKIASNTITANEIAANTITANQIAANTITASQIASGTITANEIAGNTITAAKINVSDLESNLSRIGDSNAHHIEITSSEISIMEDSTIKNASFAGDAITFYDGTSSNIAIASFGEEAVIGIDNSTHIVITSDSLGFWQDDNTEIMSIDTLETSFRMGSYTWIATDDRLTLWG